MKYFVYYYLYDSRIRGALAGPIKIYDLCDNLVKLGHEVVLFAPDIGRPAEQTAAKVVRVPAFGVPLLGILWHEAAILVLSLLRLLGGRCDAVYVRITTSFVPLLIARLTGAPLLTEVNDDPFYRYEAVRGLMRLKLPVVRFCDALNLKNSGMVLAVNTQIMEALKVRLGLPKERVEVMPSGTNTALFRPVDRAAACAELSLDPARRYLCFVGSLNHWNDYALLASAVKKITGTFPEVRCLLVGDTSAEQRRLIAASGASDKFILPGLVPPAAAAKYMAASEVCLAPLIPEWKAMTSVKIFDYLACGKPVAATRPPGVENIFSACPAVSVSASGDTEGFVSAVVRLLADPAEAARLGALGREFVVKHHDRSAAAARLAAIAKELK